MSTQASFYDMRTVFELQLGSPLLEGLATIGCFDGRTPSLVCATNTNRLIVHTPDAPDSQSPRATRASSVRSLNFGRQPTALAVGRMRGVPGRTGVDALYFGSASALLAYDVERNRELFCKTVEDGVQAMVFGAVHTAKGNGGSGGVVPTPLAVVGGNCTINGFDETGEEQLWTVTGDQVSALALVPWDATEACALVAASEDFELRVFDGKELIASIMETERVSQLIPSGAPGRFAYISSSGAVGVYDRTSRVWRARGRDRPVSAAFCDVDGDGVPELIIGWASGRVEVRGDDTSRRGVLYRTTLPAPVAAVLSHDYRRTGRALPIVLSCDGAVRGFELSGRNSAAGANAAAAAALKGRGAFALDALRRERHALAAELLRLEEQLRRHRAGCWDTTLPRAGVRVVVSRVAPRCAAGRVEIALALEAAPRDAVIQSCVMRSEAAFPGREFAFFAAQEPAASLVCCIPPPPRAAVGAEIRAAVLVGATNAACYQVHDVVIAVPAFAVCRAGRPSRTPAGYAALRFQCPSSSSPSLSSSLSPLSPLPSSSSVGDSQAYAAALAGIAPWLARTFAPHKEEEELRTENGRMRVEVVDTRDGSGIEIEADATRGEITVRADTMDACGDVVESLGAVVQVDAVASCHFPEEMEELAQLLQRIDALNVTRIKLSSDMADVAAGVKPLLVRAEDARLMGEVPTMRRFYAQLYDLNKELIDENLKRYNNYTELKAALKKVNGFIMKASRLRLGKMRAKIVSDCRDAVRQNDAKALVNLIRTGQP